MRADARRNREAVLRAGARLLSERPMASMQEIADASGLGRTTVYRHFPAREDLVAALVSEVVEEATHLAAQAMAVEGPATEALQRMAQAMVPLGRRYAFLRSEREDVQAAMGESDRAFLEWVRAAQGRGELRPDVEAIWVLCATRGLITAAIEDAEDLGGESQASRYLAETLITAFGSGDRASAESRQPVHQS